MKTELHKVGSEVHNSPASICIISTHHKLYRLIRPVLLAQHHAVRRAQTVLISEHCECAEAEKRETEKMSGGKKRERETRKKVLLWLSRLPADAMPAYAIQVPVCQIHHLLAPGHRRSVWGEQAVTHTDTHRARPTPRQESRSGVGVT